MSRSSSATPSEPRSRAREVQAELGAAMVGLDHGWNVGGQLLVGILLLGGLGWLADTALGTTPWLFAIGSLAGFGVSLYLVWLRSAEPMHDDRDRDVPVVTDGR